MSQLFTAIGAAIIICCVLWGYSWLEVWRDPKGELTDFYTRYPRAKVWVSSANKLWVPALIAGLVFLMVGILTGGKI